MAQVNSWTTATDGTCKTIATGSCKCADKTQVVGTVTSASDVLCKDEFACFKSAALPAGHCRNAIGANAWTSKTDTTCVALTAGQCRCKEDNTAQTGTGAGGACTNACTYSTTASTSGGEAGEGEGEGGEGSASSGTAGSNGVIFALFVMILSMF